MAGNFQRNRAPSATVILTFCMRVSGSRSDRSWRLRAWLAVSIDGYRDDLSRDSQGSRGNTLPLGIVLFVARNAIRRTSCLQGTRVHEEGPGIPRLYTLRRRNSINFAK